MNIDISLGPKTNDSSVAEINLEIAAHFLSILSQVDKNNKFTFQIFKDKKEFKQHFPRILHGTFDELKEELKVLNCKEDYGIFLTVNTTDFKGRKNENILKVRAFFVDLDGSPLGPILTAPISPHIIVESSLNRYHAYWIIEEAPLEKFTEIQNALIKKFNGDPAVRDLARVMRLPGFFHLKNTPYLTKIIKESGEPPISFERFCSAFNLSPALEREIASNPRMNLNSNFVLDVLKKSNMIMQKDSSYGSWTIHCPWERLHSTVDKGTKYYEPNSNGYSSHGFKCFHEHCKEKGIRDLFDFLKLGSTFPIEPMPLYRELPPSNPFPFEALGEILGNAARTLHRIIQAPDAICAQSLLGAIAHSCQPFVNVTMDGREYPISLNLITVGESGDRKSSTDKEALRPILERQKALIEHYRIALKEYNFQHDKWQSQKDKLLKENPFEATPEQFEMEEPVEPLKPLLLFEEPTYEGLVKYLDVGQPSVGLFSDEGGGFLGGYSMSKDQIQKAIAGFSSLWDGKPISRVRGGDGSSFMYGRRVSLHLMIQEIILSQVMENPIIEKQGFLPRFLIAFPESIAGTRTYVQENIREDPNLCRYWKQLQHIIELELPLETSPAPQNELKPRNLPLIKSAEKIWIEYYNANELELAPGMRLASIKRLANRTPEHVLRLAGNLAFFDDPSVVAIHPEFILKGVRLMEFYLNEALRIQGYFSIHPDLVQAKELLTWLWEKNREIVTLTQIYQYGPKKIRQKDKANKIMSILIEHGWAISTRTNDAGKEHKQAWRIREMTEKC